MSDQFVIEQDIPIPDGAPGGRRPHIYPWPRMKIGESFFVGREMKNPRSVIVRAEETTGFKFDWRRVVEERPNPHWVEDDDSVPEKIRVEGVRIWRVK